MDLRDHLEELYAEACTAGFWEGVKCFLDFLEAYDLVIAMWKSGNLVPVNEVEDEALEAHFELLRQKLEEE